MPAPRPRRPSRRALLWFGAGALLGVVLTFAALALPPVQGWLVRYAVRSQLGGEVEFEAVRVGPTEASAREVRLRLPNLAIEARALRLAVSPWQLLTRRRLAIDAVEARDLRFTAKSGGPTSAPFTGLLDGLQAPLDWAVAQAEAEGRFILEQPGADPLIATFTVRGSQFSADRSAPIDVELSVPGDFVPGWTGRWRFAGQLAYAPGAAGTLESVTLTGVLTPAQHADIAAPALRLGVTLRATATGEHYAVTVQPADDAAPALQAALQAVFTRATGEIGGDWSFATAPTLAARSLHRPNLPDLALTGKGTFREDTRAQALTLGGEVALHGSGWSRLAPELAALGAAEGKNTFQVARRGDRWMLETFDAALAVAGSDARVRFRSLTPQALLPFQPSEQAWAELEVAGVPLEWARPFLPGIQIEGGALAGAWQASTPDRAELKLTPVRPVATGRFTVAHPALPAAQPLELSLSPVLRLTPDTARVELQRMRFAFERGDFLELDAASTIDFARFTAQLDLAWRAGLPSLLAGPDRPLPFTFTGNLTALASEQSLHISAAAAEAHIPEHARPVFAARLLAPVSYAFADGRLEATPEFARVNADGLPLEWLSRFADGYALAGRLVEGEALVGLAGDRLTLRTTRAWTLTGLGLAERDEPLLHDATIALSPQLSLAWPPAAAPAFTAQLGVQATLPEVARIVDPSGPLSFRADLAGGRANEFFHLESATLDLRRGNGEALFALATERALTFRPAKSPAAEPPVWFQARLGRMPLDLLKGHLSAGQEIAGEIEPAEFVARADWPNLALKSTAPVAVQLTRFAAQGVPLLEDVRLTADPGIQNTALVHAAYVENVRGLPAGAAQLGSLGSGYIMFFNGNFQMPVALTYQTQIDLRQWQRQPVATAYSLPATGLITAGYEHDLINSRQPNFHFSLEHVVGQDGQPVAPLKAKALLSPDAVIAKNEVGMRFNVELATQPRASQVSFDATLSNADNTVTVNSVLKGDFVDIAEIERLIATTDRASGPTPATVVAPAATATEIAPAAATGEPRAPAYPFWLVLRGRFDLELGELARDHYRIQDVRGALTLGERTLAVTDLSGRTFDGAWGGDLRIDFDPAEAAAPYRARGGFRVQGLDAGQIVAAVYPEEAALFTGRLSLDTEVTSHGAGLAGLLNNSAARFDFRAESGRLRVNVPHAQLASTALVFGGVVTFSPEIRALGRLIRTLSDLPVETLHARGHRDPDGHVTLDEFRVHTPQLRLSATGTWPLQHHADWLTTPFELPVTIAARDEIGVILKGMRLLEKQPGADGFYRLNRTPKLKGTPGQPDTSELFDLLAHAADKSTGTFGLLMRKLQKEVQKSQAKN